MVLCMHSQRLMCIFVTRRSRKKKQTYVYICIINLFICFSLKKTFLFVKNDTIKFSRSIRKKKNQRIRLLGHHNVTELCLDGPLEPQAIEEDMLVSSKLKPSFPKTNLLNCYMRTTS